MSNALFNLHKILVKPHISQLFELLLFLFIQTNTRAYPKPKNKKKREKSRFFMEPMRLELTTSRVRFWRSSN